MRTRSVRSTRPSEPATIPQLLLALQAVDTQADQLGHRREHSPLRDDLSSASAEMRGWEQQRAALRARIDELGSSIEHAEERGAELLAHRQRLEQQMKTVIAPREAEALMHEIGILDAQTDALDTRELEALEEQSEIDDRLTDHLRSEATLRDAVRSADEALQRATSEIDAELGVLVRQRAERRGELDESTLARYERVRNSSGVAVAKLVGHRCEGCHLDLSAAEVDDVKDEAAGPAGVAECPNCGRILVV